jgi:hypothetical protein
VAAVTAVAVLQARALDRRAAKIVPGMSFDEVMRQLDGWWMINAHPLTRRAIPHGTGPEFNGYSGDMYVLTPVQPTGQETDLRQISREEFTARVNKLLKGGEPWIVYFSFRTVPTHRGILVRFDGKGQVAPKDGQ